MSPAEHYAKAEELLTQADLHTQRIAELDEARKHALAQGFTRSADEIMIQLHREREAQDAALMRAQIHATLAQSRGDRT